MPDSNAIARAVNSRLHAFEAEARINFLRLLSVGVFFALHVVNRTYAGLGAGRTLELGNVQIPVFDTAATALVVAWAGAAGAVLLVMRTRVFSPRVGPAITLVDIAFLAVLILIGNGPTSPLVLVLFPVIAATGLRGRRGDVWLATVASLAVYGVSLGAAINLNQALMPPSHHVLIVVTSLAMMGLVTDLQIARAWSLVERQPDLVARAEAVDTTQLTGAAGPCPWCGTHNGPGLERCGRCGQPLVSSQAVTVGMGRPPAKLGAVLAVWMGSVLAFVAVLVVIGISLSLTWPALLVPYVGAAGLLLLGVARIVQLDLRGDEDDKVVERTAGAVGVLAASMALSATLLTLLVGLAILLAATAAVIAVGLCFAVLAGAGAL
jgi:hypothetical protein